MPEASLTMAEGSLLRVVGDSAGAHSVFRVSDAFNFPEKEGSVLLDVSGLYKNAQVLRTAIFCAPASSGFTEKTFRTAADDGATMFPHYVLECEDANDVRTLYLVTKVVDPCTAKGACLNAPSKWASGVLPSEITADSHDFYDSYFWICTSDVTTDKSFYSTATLTLGNSATFELYNPKFTVSELRLMNGAKVYGSKKYSTADANITELAPTGLKTLRATVRTPWLKRESVNMVGAAGTYWLHDGVVTGNGTLYLHNPAGASNAYYELRGDNSGFGGAVKIGTDTEGTGKAVLVVNDSRNLGGPCRSYRADGLVFSTGAVLWPKQSMVLDEASRGVSVLADSSIRTDAGVSFTVNQRIDWRATLSKIGSGCLVLGGNVTTTASNTAKLLVAEGDLKVSSSEALKDVALMFGEGSGLKVTVPATDEMLRTKGFLVTAVDIPRSGISCTFDVNEGALSAMQDRYMAICTVPIGAAEAVRGRIKLPQRIPGYSVAPDERTDAESGTVTFGVRFGKGLLVVFR